MVRVGRGPTTVLPDPDRITEGEEEVGTVEVRVVGIIGRVAWVMVGGEGVGVRRALLGVGMKALGVERGMRIGMVSYFLPFF